MSEAQLEPHRSGASYQPVDPDEIDLAEYLAVIWRHRWMIVSLCLVAMVAAVAWTLTRPRVYSSNTTIVPPIASLQSQSGLGGGFGRMGGSMLRSIIDTGSGSIADIYVEILNSREVADVIMDRFDLMKVYGGVRIRSDAIARLHGATKIDASKEGSIKITVTDADPNRCAAIARAYVEELDKQNKRLSTGEASSKRIFLENRLKEVEAKLSQIDSIPTREAKVQEALYEMLIQEGELAKIEEAKSMPTIQVLDAAMVPEMPIARGTIKKGMMAAVAAFMLGVFIAFAYEYAVDTRRRRRIRMAAGRYDIELPVGGPAPMEVPGGSNAPVSVDTAALSVAAKAISKSPSEPPKQPR